MRYKELFSGGGSGGGDGDVPFDISGYLTEINTDRIDTDYLNARFDKYLELIDLEGAEQALNELHQAFPSLSQAEQKHANIFLNDVQRGKVKVDASTTFKDYITKYQAQAESDEIHQLSDDLGLNEAKLRELMNRQVTEATINEFGLYDELKETVNKTKAKAHFESIENTTIPAFKVNIRVDSLLRQFILDS